MRRPRRAARPVIGVRRPRHGGVRADHPPGPRDRRQRLEHRVLVERRGREPAAAPQPRPQRRGGAHAIHAEREPQRGGLDGIDRLLDRHHRAAERAVRRLDRGRERHGRAALGAPQHPRALVELAARGGLGGRGHRHRHRQRADRAPQIALLDLPAAAGARGHGAPPRVASTIAAAIAPASSTHSAIFHHAIGTAPVTLPVWPLITTRSAGRSSR